MKVCIYAGEALSRYSLGESHPFGPQRHDYFMSRFNQENLNKISDLHDPVQAARELIELFHTHEYVDRVMQISETGDGFLDAGDTPAFKGMYEAAATVVGTTLAAIDNSMSGSCARAFIPIAGLHHGRRNAAAGFCVFNDCGVAIEYLRKQYDIERILYVDIDAHHGDGVYYSFEDDAELTIVDMHEDGQTLYPGTGAISETGSGNAVGSKQNYAMKMGANDADFFAAWESALPFMEKSRPQFVLFQCGADSLAGDPITHLQYTEQAHKKAASDLCKIADKYANGRLVAMGGGGYNLDNLARAWCAVIKVFSN